jgi:DNA processing protein
MNQSEDKMFFIAFNYLINFTLERYKKLIKKFNTLEKAFYANSRDLLEAGLKRELVFDFILARKSFDFEQIFKKIKTENINVCLWGDVDYPELLANIYSPPPIFYYRGSLDVNWNKALSVVGSRKFTPYGEKIAKDFVSSLSQVGIGIISGLAIGIDSLAHRESLEKNNKTIAVLGSGLDYSSIYPRSNRALAQEIVEKGGLVLSEFPLGTEPASFNFPKRNRIIAGLSRATLVVEASKKSGSLITAKYALDEGREVFTFPGNIYDDNFSGNNNLIKSGAGVVLFPEEILDFFNILPLPGNRPNKSAYKGENELEERVLDILRENTSHIDELLEILPFNIKEISSVLAVLEIKGVIVDVGGKNYKIA